MADDTPHTPKRRRSPSYPAIDLQSALERAVSLYRQEGRNTAPNAAVLGHWGYSANSGPGFGTLGALKRFGLLKSEGAGKSRLSELALRIVLDERDDSAERDEAVKQAALAPGIHREIWEKYSDGLPSDATLRHFLRLDKGFTDNAADELIKEFRSTVAFANLTPGDSLSGNARDSDPRGDTGASVSDVLVARKVGGSRQEGLVSVPIPLSTEDWVNLEGPFPLSEESWDQLMRVLAVMKPGLVSEGRADPATTSDDAL